MKARLVFAISLALLVLCYLAVFIATWSNREYVPPKAFSLFPFGVCCYITLFISGILIPQPTQGRRAPSWRFRRPFCGRREALAGTKED